MLVLVAAVTVPATPPKVTVVVATVPKLVPVMVTVWPPLVGPESGDTLVMVGTP